MKLGLSNSFNLSVLLCLAAPVAVKAVDGPGFGQVTFDDSELYKPVATLIMPKEPQPFGNNLVSMHKGYMLVVFAPDHMLPGGGLRFYDMSDPRHPKVVNTLNTPQTQEFVEAHGYGASSSYPGDYAVFQSRIGIQFWDLTDVMNPKLIKDMALPSIDGGGYDNGVFCVFWQAPYVFTASSAHGIHVVDATDPYNPRLVRHLLMNQTGNFRAGLIFAVGNLLMTSAVGLDSISHGYAFFDISNPENPQQLSFPKGLPDIYASLINGNKVYGTGLDSKLYVHDVSNPRDIKLVSTSEVLGPTHGEYIYIQDHFAMAAEEEMVWKVDLNTMKPIGKPMVLLGDAQEGHPVPFGNYLVVGDDHTIGTGIIPHIAAPDIVGPSVNMVNPADGSVNQALTSRVGITLTDMFDLRSVGKTSFIVREVGGTALPGKYSGQLEILNFSPDQPLKPGTKYEVVIPKGGIKDVSGNTTPEEFISTFTTKAASAIIPRAAFVGAAKGMEYWSAEGRLQTLGSGKTASGWYAPVSKDSHQETQGRKNK